MNTYTSHSSQNDGKRQTLEEKLKAHIQREFCLGEKVIELLKQKKQLETRLQDQLQAQESLKKELETAVESKKALEQKFLSAQKTLKQQQKALQKRSRRIVASEEDSRETLDQLRRKIQNLKEQLEVVDKQKVEEHTRLFWEIEDLRQKEETLNQELQQILSQRDRVEKQLHSTRGKFQKLSRTHQDQKRQYELQIKSLLDKHLNLESTIKALIDEHTVNENTLRQDIQSLEISKAQLEKKIQQLEQKNAQTSWDLDADLLQVIEKQEQFIQELKKRAHKRSSMLRTENEDLKKKIEEMSKSQEKVRWENRMLESSLKGLQADLTEYIHIQKKVEDAQREKEHFEELFQRKLKFLENHDMEESEREETKKDLSKLKKRSEKQRSKNDQAAPSEGHVRSETSSRKSRLLNWLNMSSGVLLNIALVLIVVGLSVVIYRLIPWEYIRIRPSSPTKQISLESLEESREIEDFEVDKIVVDLEEKTPEDREVMSIIQTQEETLLVSEKSQHATFSKESQLSEEVLLSEAAEPVKTTRISKTENRINKKPPVTILVQLFPEQANRFPSQDLEPFPTVENNIILRRHHEQK